MNNITKRLTFCLAISSLGFLLPIHAGQPENNFCGRVSNSQQIFECSKYEKEKADRLLNAAYSALKERIAKQYEPDPKLKGIYTQKIRESQHIWIRLRDADCTLEVFEIEIGTQAYETTLNKCMARANIERAAYLEKISPEI